VSVEGTRSYGIGLARALAAAGLLVIECERPSASSAAARASPTRSMLTWRCWPRCAWTRTGCQCGALERTYVLRLTAATIRPDQLDAMSVDDHRQAFMAFVAVGDFDRYLDRGDIDLLRDGVSYRMTGLWLDDAEHAELLRGTHPGAPAPSGEPAGTGPETAHPRLRPAAGGRATPGRPSMAAKSALT
jgi:hypothetical protein